MNITDTNFKRQNQYKCGFTEQEILARKAKIQSSNDSAILIHCPNGQAHKDDDHNPSAYYFQSSGWLGCHACDLKGFANDRDSATYVYSNGDKKHRKRTDNSKDQYRTESFSEEKPLPYGAERIGRQTNLLYIVEGEKCCEIAQHHACRQHGERVAVLTSGASSSFNKVDWKVVHKALQKKSAQIYFLPDHDVAGEKYIEAVARCLQQSSMQVIRVAEHDSAPTYDVADWLENHDWINLPEPVEIPLPDMTKEGEYLDKNYRVLNHALHQDRIEIRKNIRFSRTEYREIFSENGWVEIDDEKESNIKEHIRLNHSYIHCTTKNQQVKPLEFTREGWRDGWLAVQDGRRVDPFKDWLKQLPTHDGTSRIDNLLHNLFNADTSDLNQWGSRYILIGAIQRTFEPGCKLDEVPILVGNQGIGKSALLRNILPKWIQDTGFSDTLALHGTPQQQAESILGRVICEVAEMQGSTRAEHEHIKTLITRQNDNIRLAYRRNPDTNLRRGIFVGTTDRSDSLPNDPAGLRRFVPIELNTACNVEEYLEQHRDQLWREGLDRYLDGESANLPISLKSDQMEMAEQHRNADEIIENIVNRTLGEKHFPPFTLEQFRGYLPKDSQDRDYLTNSKSDTMRLSAALKSQGYTRKRVSNPDLGKQEWLWAIWTA